MDRYYNHYFEDLAKKNKAIAHTNEAKAYFFIQDQFDLEAFDNAIGAAGKTPAFLLEDFSTEVYDGSSRNYGDSMSCRFTIVDKTDVGDHDSIIQAKERCKKIARQFLNRMLKDLGDGGVITIAPGDTSRPVFFKLSSVKLGTVGPMAADYYGVTVGFELTTGVNAQSVDSDWST